jgi:DNA helicase-2/ATP-dependent DNA helicase PcrA
MFVADLHIHSKYSRATSRDLDVEHLYVWAQKKGIDLVGTGDVTHPAWVSELKAALVPDGSGLYQVRPDLARSLDPQVPAACRRPVRFVLQCEVSSIYKFGDRVRKVHNVLLFPDFDAVDRFDLKLSNLGNLESDGRPILGLDSRDVLEIALTASPDAICIPAHIWTPWFSVLGSKSGFDSLADCYRDLLPHIHAVETGLSSDPPMNWRVSSLDPFYLVSCSDAHSPDKLAREATIFDCAPSYWAILRELRAGKGVAGTIEFFPEEGKYHVDGHRKCNTRLEPEETRRLNGLCPACGKPVTVGVLNRVNELADRPAGTRGKRARNFYSLVGLDQVIAECQGTSGRGGKGVLRTYEQMLSDLGPELAILLDRPLDAFDPYGSLVRTAVQRVREGTVHLEPGFDGEFGVVRVFAPEERKASRPAALFPARGGAPAVPAGRAPLAASEPEPDGTHPAAPEPEPDGTHPAAPEPEPDGTRHAAPEPEPEVPRLLTPEQEAVVTAPAGRRVVVAGPGSGKTRTLIHRVARLLEQGAAPESVVVLTFTRKAAEEIRTRLSHKVGQALAGRIFAGTFHSYALELANRKRAREGLPRLAVCSAADRKVIEGRAQQETGERPGSPRHEAACRNLISRHGLVELDEIVSLGTAAIPESGREVPAPGFLLVDEFQDIDEAQYRFVERLAAHTHDVTVIGDPNQSIYGFRGASPAFFDRFVDGFGGQRCTLGANHRSVPQIQALSGMLMGLRPWDPALGDRASDIVLSEQPTERAEAEHVAHTVERLVGGTASFSFNSDRVESGEEAGFSFGDIAVLTRTAGMADHVTDALLRLGVPVLRHAVSPAGFQEALDLLEAGCRVAANPDDDLARLRVEEWARGVRKEVGEFSVTRLLVQLKTLGRSAPDAGRLAALLLPDRSEPETRVISESLRTALPALFETSAARTRGACSWGDMAFLLATLREEETTRAGVQRVSVLTMHASKGLEFDVVFLCGLEEGLLPYTVSGTPADPEEERRLLYVAMTRARKRLYLSWARTRSVFGRRCDQSPSRFLASISQRLSVLRREPPKPKQTRGKVVQPKLL